MCKFGKKRCLGNRCLGYGIGEACDKTEDCNPFFFCNEGTCRLEKNDEEICSKHLECSRGSLCFKGGPGSYNSQEYGVCKAFFSLEDGLSKNYPF